MQKLRMGIIGAGMAFEKLHYPAYQELQDRYQIVAICDPDQKKIAKWQQTFNLQPGDLYTDYRQMMTRQDIDAFDIMVPIELNFTVTKEVAQAGKPIICEKPLGANSREAEEAKELPRRYNIPIMIAENYRYEEEMDKIRDLVRTREIGDVYCFIQSDVMDFPEEMLGNSWPSTEWRQHPEFVGGAILDYCVHNIAGFHHIFGSIDKIQAFGIPLKGNHEYSPYAALQASIKFANGVLGQFSFFTKGIEAQRPLVGLRIFGTQGTIYLEERKCGIINIAYNDGSSKQIQYQPGRGYYNELLNFHQAALRVEPISSTPEIEYGDAMTIFALLKSVREEEVVSPNQQPVSVG